MSLAPVFMVVDPSKGVCKKCSGMLNELPYMVHVKRETQHLLARKCEGYRVEKVSQVSTFQSFKFETDQAWFGTPKPGLIPCSLHFRRWRRCDLPARHGPRAGLGRWALPRCELPREVLFD